VVSKHNERRIKILIADDHPIFRDGLRRLLESEAGFEEVARSGGAQMRHQSARQNGARGARLLVGAPVDDENDFIEVPTGFDELHQAIRHLPDEIVRRPFVVLRDDREITRVRGIHPARPARAELDDD
jgi:DNA-binding NarL/FixJ family response regulator